MDDLLDDDAREASVGVAGVSSKLLAQLLLIMISLNDALSDVALSDVPWWESYYAAQRTMLLRHHLTAVVILCPILRHVMTVLLLLTTSASWY